MTISRDFATAAHRPKTSSMTAPRLGLTLRLLSGGVIALGPGKADLLEAIAASGSISAAAPCDGAELPPRLADGRNE